MVNFRDLKNGDEQLWKSDSFIDKFTDLCEVVEVYKDHVLAEIDGMKLWIDDDTAEMFTRR